jgi:hypothetical protein
MAELTDAMAARYRTAPDGYQDDKDVRRISRHETFLKHDSPRRA